MFHLGYPTSGIRAIKFGHIHPAEGVGHIESDGAESYGNERNF
jgi:hypothetical protein